jgi:DNA-binding transcriptional MocR family regulator
MAIAEAIARDLENGRLAPGTRLPTHRLLADRLGVTIGTASRGYAEARRRGLVTGEVGRGTFVRSSSVDSVSFGRTGNQDGNLIDLSVNYPGFAAGDELHPALMALQKQGQLSRLLQYQPPAGAMRHRRLGAEWLTRFGLDAVPEEIVVTCGAQHAMLLVFSVLTEPGDLVLAESLTYAGMKALARTLRIRLEGVAVDEQGLRPDAFEAACRAHRPKALYCMPTIQNPTATVMPAERRREIAEIARAHGVAIVEDDIYRFLLTEAPAPITTWSQESGYYLTSLSKSITPGLRIGYLRAPRSAIEKLEATVMSTTTMASPLTAEIASILIEDGTADAIMRQRRKEIGERQSLARKLLGPYVTRGGSEASYHLWLGLPDPWRAEEFVAQARSRGVAVNSSEIFAVGRGAAPHAIRLCLGATEDRLTLERGLKTLADLLAGSPPPSLSGV